MQCSGNTLQFYPRVSHSVFPLTGRDHTSHFSGGATAGEISSIHDDIGHPLYLCDRLRPQRAFQVQLKH